MESPTRVEVSSGETVRLTWEDGGETQLTAREVRAGCPCATCREPAGQKQLARVLSGPDPVKIRAASIVGGYAINFVFLPDGHGTGIYPYDLLRALGEDLESQSS